MLTSPGGALAQAEAQAEAQGQPSANDEPQATQTPPAASADEPWNTPIKPGQASYRSGFQLGVSFGLGPGAANGYPADARKIGRAEHYTESGIGLGTYGALWLGGALADGFAFGVGAGGGTIGGSDTTSSEWNILFHGDVYPLFSLGDAYRDLGVAFEAGTAFATTRNDDDDVVIDGNGSAYVSAGVFWEGLSFWQVRSGPFVGVHYLFGETIRRPLALAGFRATLTSGP